MSWAKPLAKALTRQWAFLQRFVDEEAYGGRDARQANRLRALALRKIAATLGSRLDEQWNAGDVVRLVERHAGLKFGAVIAPGDAHSPLSYLAAMLDRALTNPHAEVPHSSPVRAAFERRALAAELVAEAARSAALRAELARPAASAAVSDVQTWRQAARTAAATAHSPARQTRRTEPDPERMRQARAEIAQLAARNGANPEGGASIDSEWPETAMPGAGIPWMADGLEA